MGFETEISKQDLLEKILFWVKYDYSMFREKIIRLIESDEKKIVFEYSDGERSMRKLADIAGLPKHHVIGNWWKEWFDEGLVDQTEKYGGGRYKKIASLSEFGIHVPDPKVEVVDD